MKKIQLNTRREQAFPIFALVDDDSACEVGKHSWFALRQKKNTYAARWDYRDNIKVLILMHRQILGTPDGFVTDHKDGNGLNNQRNNLRAATVSNNAANIKSQVGSSSKYLGVSWERSRRKWRASICKGKNNVMIGRFNKEEEAAIAYNIEAVRLHGEFANLNEVNG